MDGQPFAETQQFFVKQRCVLLTCCSLLGASPCPGSKPKLRTTPPSQELAMLTACQAAACAPRPESRSCLLQQEPALLMRSL